MDVLEQVRALLSNSDPQWGANKVISTGHLTATDDTLVEYEIREGWSLLLGYACDKLWRDFNVRLMEFVEKNFPPEKHAEVLAGIQMGDSHWDWLQKNRAFKTDEYRWFFLTTEGEPQGACLIYHPKPSVATPGSNIFYIEFIATAPWNRDNPMAPRRFRAVGSILIGSACKYAHEVLKLRHGFSLLALPGAVDYYKKIGMRTYPQADQPPLVYFEMDERDASLLVGK